MTRALDYLVVGAVSSRLWSFGVCGTKVKKVKDNRAKGSVTAVMDEGTFLDQVEDTQWPG